MADNIFGEVPLDFQPEMQNISQQQKLSQMLLQQGMQQPQGQMISGHYVAPSWTQYLQPLFGAYAGSKGMETAENKQLELAKAIRGGRELERQAAIKAIQQGKPTEALALPNVYGGTTPFQSALVKAAIPETPTSVREYEYAQQNPQYAGYVAGMKRAGAPSVSVSMEKGIAGQIGPMLKEAKPQAVSAVKGIDAANQVINALDTNKLFTGPLANQRLSIAQLGATFGGATGDLTQKINNTRSAIQGLAEITLQGRQEMHGQGAITESEGKLAERAKSGDISFTPGELKQLANAAKRAGEYTYGNYQAQVQSLSKNPETAQMIPFFNVNPMPERQMPQAPAQPNVNQQLNIPATGGWRIK